MTNPITVVKDAFRLFIVSLQQNTAALLALTSEQKELRTKFDALVADSNYLVTTKKRELQRSGHKVGLTQ
jgi:hypothetical protein